MHFFYIAAETYRFVFVGLYLMPKRFVMQYFNKLYTHN